MLPVSCNSKLLQFKLLIKVFLSQGVEGRLTPKYQQLLVSHGRINETVAKDTAVSSQGKDISALCFLSCIWAPVQ